MLLMLKGRHQKSIFSATAAVLTAAVGAFAPNASAALYDLSSDMGATVRSFVWGASYFTTEFEFESDPCCCCATPFLSIGNDGVEKGYNTSGAQVLDNYPFDSKQRDIQFKDLTQTVLSGGTYFSFMISLNESLSDPDIVLEELKIFTSSQASLSTENIKSLGTKRFDLDEGAWGGNVSINMRDVNPDPLDGEVAFFVPTGGFLNGFNNADADDYVYLYAKLSGAEYLISPLNDGYEGFFYFNNIKPVPEVSAVLPLIALVGLTVGTRFARRGRPAKATAAV
jgi:hypothetical protein